MNSPGFGVERSSAWSNPQILLAWEKDNATDEKLPRYSPSALDYPAKGTAIGHGHEPLARLHRDGVMAFAGPSRLGFARDRNHVVGFRPHRFGGESERLYRPNWSRPVLHLQLIGLLLHEQPVAYVTDEFPRMSERRDVPTRELDPFESAALEQLRAGEDLIVADGETAMQLVGAVRNAQACVTCHGGERGDLLGAFSYTLKTDELKAGGGR